MGLFYVKIAALFFCDYIYLIGNDSLPGQKNQQTSNIEMPFMKRALALAEKGRGLTSPNPVVGAVVVKDNKIVGEGYHEKFGAAHAEINAMDQAGDDSLGATLYVTLEPCIHAGKTGPCAERIFEAGISRVVVGMTDPNPVVNGKGIAFLKSKGITVKEGILEDKCRELNVGYLKHIVTGHPFITLKIAQTLDGRIATSTGHSKWITSEESRTVSHRLRTKHDALLVGIGTILMDDPHLTARLVKGPSPKRIILDSQLRVPLDANVFSEDNPNKAIVVTTNNSSKEKITRIVERGSTVLVLDADERGWVPQDLLWKKLGELGITSVLVEGGSTVHTECLKSHNADQLILFFAPKLLGSGIDSIGELGIRNMNSALELYDTTIKRLNTDFIITGRLKQERGAV